MSATTNTIDGAVMMQQELIQLLREIRPSFGDVGSRDIDTRRRQQQIDRAIELLSASDAVATLGWKLVPNQPTTEMLTAGSGAIDLHSHSPLALWGAMLAASPAAPTQSESTQMFAPLYKKLMRGDVDIGESYLKLRAVGSCPTQEEFCAALASLIAV